YSDCPFTTEKYTSVFYVAFILPHSLCFCYSELHASFLHSFIFLHRLSCITVNYFSICYTACPFTPTAKYFFSFGAMHPYIKPLQEQFRLHADPEIAAGQAAYMRDQFAFMGIKTPLRRRLTITWYKQSLPLPQELPAIVKELWNLPEREFQYAAIELAAAMKKQWTVSLIRLAEYMITHKSWWDSVDA